MQIIGVIRGRAQIVRVALAVKAHDGIGVTAVLIPPVVARTLH
jgi:hypothetical protein